MVDAKWKKFERLVAALHIAEQKGAKVVWNDIINGRQFDVTVRFKAGLYNYLTVIECKNYTNSVPVRDVEAFITKSNDVNADKSVIVSSNGFQSGAIQVAEKHKVALVTLKKLNTLTAEETANDFSPVLLIFFFRFQIENKNDYIAIPEEIGILKLFMRESKVIGKHINTTPEKIAERYVNEAINSATNIPQTIKIDLPPKTEFIQPNGIFRYKVSSFLFDYCLISVNNLTSTEGLGVDYYLSGDVFELKDEKSGESTLIDTSLFDYGFDTKIEAGKFYENPKLDFYYYCEEINKKSVRMCLVESYQNNHLIQAEFIISVENTKQFIEIKDDNKLMRLKSIYKKFRSNNIS